MPPPVFRGTYPRERTLSTFDTHELGVGVGFLSFLLLLSWSQNWGRNRQMCVRSGAAGSEGGVIRTQGVPAPSSPSAGLSLGASTIAVLYMCSGSWRRKETPSEGGVTGLPVGRRPGGVAQSRRPGARAPRHLEVQPAEVVHQFCVAPSVLH